MDKTTECANCRYWLPPTKRQTDKQIYIQHDTDENLSHCNVRCVFIVIMLLLSVCPFGALLKATYADKALKFNLFCVWIYISFTLCWCLFRFNSSKSVALCLVYVYISFFRSFRLFSSFSITLCLVYDLRLKKKNLSVSFLVYVVCVYVMFIYIN